MEVDVEHKDASRFEAPRDAGWFDPRAATGFPDQEVAVRVDHRCLDVELTAEEPRAGSLLLTSGATPAIDQHVRVMNGCCSAWAHLHTADEMGSRDGSRDDELQENVGTFGCYG